MLTFSRRGVTFLVLLVIMSLSSVSHEAYASILKEVESNDTIYTAQLIMKNSQTIQEAAGGNYSNQHGVKGNTSKTDEDWFMVSLNAGNQYLTCNGSDFDYEIYKSTNTTAPIKQGSFRKWSESKVFPISITQTGYYYIKIIGIISTAQEYSIQIGEPNYGFSDCQLPCTTGSVSMTKSTPSKTITFNNSGSSIEAEAIAYSVTLKGIGATDVASPITLTNSGVNLNLYYPWTKMNIESLSLPVTSGSATPVWSAKLKYSRNTTFTPYLKVYYVYPRKN